MSLSMVARARPLSLGWWFMLDHAKSEDAWWVRRRGCGRWGGYFGEGECYGLELYYIEEKRRFETVYFCLHATSTDGQKDLSTCVLQSFSSTPHPLKDRSPPRVPPHADACTAPRSAPSPLRTSSRTPRERTMMQSSLPFRRYIVRM